MQTRLADFVRDTPAGREADAILRSCVHCGFCTATCPTYQLLGDELDGPRGRIYLIKQVLEGEGVGRRTQVHLDRCLTCRSCETTCPSGVRYGRLAEIGRAIVEARVRRPWQEALVRRLLRMLVPYPRRFAALIGTGRLLRPLLPAHLRRKVPIASAGGGTAEVARPPAGTRHMLILDGCAQSVLAPQTNAAAARVLARLGIGLKVAPRAGCCGALSQHLAAEDEARAQMRRNIDAWWPAIEAGAEAVVSTASACGLMLKEYGEVFRDDPVYAAKAARVAALARDIVEVVEAEIEHVPHLRPATGHVAFHSPCTLQHGQRLGGRVEAVLDRLGFRATPVADGHLCCGSAGTYSLLQPELSERLRANRLEALGAGGPECIATANIGCRLHLQSGTDLPVRHWIELVDEAWTGAGDAASDL